MGKVNRGKDFERVIKECLERIENVSVYRLYDTMNGFSGVANISDFIVYKRPIQAFIECKTHYGKSFPLSCITERQLTGMLEQSKIDGVKCGIIVWFIDLDKTYYINVVEVQKIKEQGYKSINEKMINDGVLNAIEIQGKKKRTFFDYDLTCLFSETDELR